MDPNHWNTYNFQYGAAQGGLTPTHSSLAGLSLTHGLQGTHGGRSVSALPSVNYTGLSMPILETMAPLSTSMQPQQAHHKSMGIGEAGQIMFDPQVRVSAEQLSPPSINRYEAGNKMLRTEGLSRTQLLEAARVWGGPNFPATSSLYNQYSAMLPDVASMSAAAASSASILSSPGAGNYSSSSSKSSSQHQPILQEPPPAHSSNIVRLTSCQRTPHVMEDLIYSRPSSESLNPSSLSHNQQVLQTTSSVHHRQASGAQTPQYLSSHGRDTLSSAAVAQHQIYGSYSNLSTVDSQDFAPQQHMSGGDISYEAVSPAAPPVQQQQQPNPHENTTPAHMETPSFSLAQFPEFANLAPEHAQALVDKFQENDFRLKLDPSSAYHQGGGSSRQQQVKNSKDNTASSDLIHPMHQMNQQQQSSSAAFSHIQPTTNISHSPSPHLLSSHSAAALTLSAMQLQTPPTVQAPADSTTKPKRVRNRKKKGETTPAACATDDTNKSVSHTPTVPPAQRHHNLSHMPPSSQISSLSLPHSPHMIRDSQQQQPPPQQMFTTPGNNHYTSQDAQRAQTPSMPQNYSLNDPQAFTHSPSPKIQNDSNPSVLMSPAFNNMSSGIINEKSSASTYKKPQQRKPRKQSNPAAANTRVSNNNNSSNVNQNSQSMYMSNIPNNCTNQTNQMSIQQQQQQQQQGYPTNPNPLMESQARSNNTSRDSNSSNNRGGGSSSTSSGSSHVSRLGGFPVMPGQQQHLPQHSLDTSPMSNVNHQQQQQSHSPQDNTNKLHTPSHYLTNPSIINLQQQSDARQSSSSQPQSPSLIPQQQQQQQQVVMSHNPAAGFDTNRGTAAVIIDGNDPSNQFQMDFGSQPFLEQLVSDQNPNFGQTAAPQAGEEVMLTTLVTPGEQQQQQQQSQESTGDNSAFRPTYHGGVVHEIHAVGAFDDGGMGVGGDMSYNANSYDNGMNPNQQSHADYGRIEPEPMTLTFMPSLDEDDEFNHFGGGETTAAVIKEEPQAAANPGSKKENFQDSFLSYLQGNKQETLSSVSSSAVTKKPQLPKYIPEPKRPKPPPVVTVLKDPTPASSTSLQEDKDFLSALSDNENSSQKSENSDKEGYTVQRTSELAMKITLPKGKKKGKISTLGESALLSHNKKQQHKEEKAMKKKKGRYSVSDGEEFAPSDEEGLVAPLPVKREPTPPPARTSIGRKAKDLCMEKTKKKRKYAESGSSSEDEVYIRKTGLDSDKDYDSDKDPVWCPFETDLKAGYDLVEKKKKPLKRVKLRAPIRAPPSSSPKTPTVAASPQTNSSAKGVTPSYPPAVKKTPQASATTSSAQDDNIYPVGQYLIERKDLQNYENYPIWRLEQGSMIHKYELVVQEGVVRHRAVGTYSTWMKSMYDLFDPIKVNELVVKGKTDAILVQVLEEFQPKMPTDGKLIQQYEDDPLVETFNIYLQVMISQALEPTFLKAILGMGESFYLDPLNEIDQLVDGKVEQLAALVKWKQNFQEVVHRCPLMKEIDRPNLKQACQACENSSPPTIKSVLLSGQAYDRKLLTNIQGSGTDAAHEFMIGKLAAHYIQPYHSLYHFKYWLRTRCEAKVKVMKESNKSVSLSGEAILDKCLENRTWVLQLFDHFKKMLTFDAR